MAELVIIGILFAISYYVSKYLFLFAAKKEWSWAESVVPIAFTPAQFQAVELFYQDHRIFGQALAMLASMIKPGNPGGPGIRPLGYVLYMAEAMSQDAPVITAFHALHAPFQQWRAAVRHALAAFEELYRVDPITEQAATRFRLGIEEAGQMNLAVSKATWKALEAEVKWPTGGGLLISILFGAGTSILLMILFEARFNMILFIELAIVPTIAAVFAIKNLRRDQLVYHLKLIGQIEEQRQPEA